MFISDKLVEVVEKAMQSWITNPDENRLHYLFTQVACDAAQATINEVREARRDAISTK